ncbi:hypothetical protein Peur_014164 [Populus x canadensis]
MIFPKIQSGHVFIKYIYHKQILIRSISECLVVEILKRNQGLVICCFETNISNAVFGYKPQACSRVDHQDRSGLATVVRPLPTGISATPLDVSSYFLQGRTQIKCRPW